MGAQFRSAVAIYKNDTGLFRLLISIKYSEWEAYSFCIVLMITFSESRVCRQSMVITFLNKILLMISKNSTQVEDKRATNCCESFLIAKPK